MKHMNEKKLCEGQLGSPFRLTALHCIGSYGNLKNTLMAKVLARGPFNPTSDLRP